MDEEAATAAPLHEDAPDAYGDMEAPGDAKVRGEMASSATSFLKV